MIIKNYDCHSLVLIPSELSLAISHLHATIEHGDEQEMFKWAYEVDRLFNTLVPDPFKDFETAVARFEWASAMIDFYIQLDDTAHAAALRNRIIAHYQAVRKAKNYSVPQKHELKLKLKEIKGKTQFHRPASVDFNSDESKRFLFIVRAYAWFAELHGMRPKEGMDYLKPFNIDSLLTTLPTDLPKDEVIERMTRFCYEKGGALAPRFEQKHYLISGKPSTHLYVIGNGFDRYHGAESGYQHFRRYLFRRSPMTVGYFDLYFGPRSLDRSFSTPVGWFWCMQPYVYRHNEYGLRYPVATWSRSNLWCDFETNLSELNREKIFDLLDMQLPRVDEGDPGFVYSEYYGPLDDISEAVQQCTIEMKYHFHRWVNTLHYKKGFRKRLLSLDSDAVFLNFNYTLFLESEYGIPSDRICYIHGNRRERFGSLVLGHHADDWEAFERWKHKNQNRRRYRHVQKDAKGRYFMNDKLAYLAFFHKNDKTANWRLPIRYYAVNEAENRLEKYYEENFKNTRSIIEAHRGFFDSLEAVEKITVIGSSLGKVDMDYYRVLRQSVKDDAHWEFSYHSENDLMRIKEFCEEMRIKDGNHSIFKL